MKAKQEVQQYRDELYEEHIGLTKGPVAKALNEMNDEIGLTNPYCRPVKNMSENWINDIPPGGFGVRTAKSASGKFLKDVKVVKEQSKGGQD